MVICADLNLWVTDSFRVNFDEKRDDRMQRVPFKISFPYYQIYIKGLWSTQDQGIIKATCSQCLLGCWWLYASWFTGNWFSFLILIIFFVRYSALEHSVKELWGHMLFLYYFLMSLLKSYVLAKRWLKMKFCKLSGGSLNSSCSSYNFYGHFPFLDYKHV